MPEHDRAKTLINAKVAAEHLRRQGERQNRTLHMGVCRIDLFA